MNAQDADIIARCLKGYETAYADLYAAHAARVRVYFLRCGFDPADADDLTQETFLRVFRSLRGFDAARGPLIPWIGAIARTIARKRWDRLVQPEPFDPQLTEESFAVDDRSGSNAAEVLAGEFTAMNESIEGMDETAERIVRLRYVEGRTTRSIGEAVGEPEATVRRRLGEVRGELLEHLREKGFEI
ncbi:MAG: RNA polymerase sigma factor [Phycisphaerae bacterium]|nr:RNA polymerase sigma factor [Phycisphaerae bacterium]